MNSALSSVPEGEFIFYFESQRGVLLKRRQTKFVRNFGKFENAKNKSSRIDVIFYFVGEQKGKRGQLGKPRNWKNASGR